MTDDEFFALTEDEQMEIYGPLFPIVEEFEREQERELTEREAGLLVVFAKWLRDLDTTGSGLQ